MAVRKSKEDVTPPTVVAVPPPVAEGYANLQSLGRFVDEMMRHSADGRAVGAFSSDSDRDISSDDPKPITPPEPVPDGDDHGTRGTDPETFETK